MHLCITTFKAADMTAPVIVIGVVIISLMCAVGDKWLDRKYKLISIIRV